MNKFLDRYVDVIVKLVIMASVFGVLLWMCKSVEPLIK
jgi:hypothetical protein